MAKLGASLAQYISELRHRSAACTLASGKSHAMMKLAVIVLAIRFAVSLAPAEIAPTPQPADCNPGTLTDYMKLSDQGCAVGKYRLSNFEYRAGPDGLPPDAITVTPGVSLDSDDPGILVEGNWSTPLRQPSVISYTVEPLAKGRLLVSGTLQMQFGQIAGSGDARVATTICPGAGSSSGHCAVSDVKLQVFLSAGLVRKVSDDGQLPGPASRLRITNAISITAGKNGAASFNGFLLILHAAGTSPSSNPQ